MRWVLMDGANEFDDVNGGLTWECPYAPRKGRIAYLRVNRHTVNPGTATACVINIWSENPTTALGKHLIATMTLAGGSATGYMNTIAHYELSDLEHSAPTLPTVVMTATGQPSDGDTITLPSGEVLTFKTTPVDDTHDVQIGTAFDDSYTNMAAAINALRTNVRAAYATGPNTLTLTPGDVEYPAGAGTYIASGWDDASLVAWTGGISESCANLGTPAVTAGYGSQHKLYVEFENPAVVMNLMAEMVAESEELGAV